MTRDPSDAAWAQAAREHVILMERDYGLHPDQAIFQSWHGHPTDAMPETSPDTLGSLVDFYVATKSSPRLAGMPSAGRRQSCVDSNAKPMSGMRKGSILMTAA
jgi:hypothetical protein